jgi:hypothetical protein
VKRLRIGLILTCILGTLIGCTPTRNTSTRTMQTPVDIGFSSIPANVQDKITGVSFNKRTPVKMSDLSYVKVRYIGFDNKEHMGELIIHKKLSKEVLAIFEELYQRKFPIEKIRLIDEYKGSDNLSMRDNNTSAFNTRVIAGKIKLSSHSYGMAIDINPLQNPEVQGNKVSPGNAKSYVDRQIIRQGMIIKDDICYNAFKKRGWSWGGEWKSKNDYQHFEKKI